MADVELHLISGIAIGFPVRPDLLGQSLEAFEKFLPLSHTLRLCHRFGRGPQAYITKLPIEMLAAVEDCIFDDLRSKMKSWQEMFSHFESKCLPLDHVPDDFEWWEAEEKAFDNLCEECQEDGLCEFQPDYTGHDGCFDAVMKEANEMMMDNLDWYFDECVDMRYKWQGMIKQKDHFAKYDQLLLKHTGLRAFFATTRSTEATKGLWAKQTCNVMGEALETTVCWLTLPRTAKADSFGMSELELEGFGAHIQGCQSMLMNLPSAEKQASWKTQFSFARRLLRLNPFLHESQLGFTADAEIEVPEPAATSTDENQKARAEEKSTKKKPRNREDIDSPVQANALADST